MANVKKMQIPPFTILWQKMISICPILRTVHIPLVIKVQDFPSGVLVEEAEEEAFEEDCDRGEDSAADSAVLRDAVE